MNARIAVARFLARLADKLITGAVCISIIYAIGIEYSYMYLYPPYIVGFPFLEATVLAVFQQTPGKALLGLAFNMNGRFTYPLALRRSWNVWIRGEALLLPIVGVIANYIAFHRVCSVGKTSWDRDLNIGVELRHPSSQRDRYVGGTIVIGLLVAFIFL